MGSTSDLRTRSRPFKPRARLLLLLGDQLIRDPEIGVFELVKNAYDADAPEAVVTMSHVTEPHRGAITIDDNGSGMDFETVINVWLEPGTDYRSRQRAKGERTPKYHRLPLGEKGVGRFAAHKLGSKVRLVTRKRDRAEVIVDIDWSDFEHRQYLDEVQVNVHEREPELFKGRRTGTRIEITQLRNEWTRGMVRKLARSVNAICSPFEGEGDFKARLSLPDHGTWLDGLLDVEKVLEYSLFRAKCEIRGKRLAYRYRFVPLPGMKVEGRTRNNEVPLKARRDEALDLTDHQIGPVHLDLYIFDRDRPVLELAVTDRQGLKEFLDEEGGVRVYRDGIRVYDYGEPGNDWLGLGGRRVNVPTRRISNNLVIGAASLKLDESHDLVEKTNREGFVENAAFDAFRDAVALAVQHIETERNIDKKRIRAVYSGPKREPVLDDVTELRAIVEKRKLQEQFQPYLDRIEADFRDVRDRLLTGASAGLSLAIVIHELEKGVAELKEAVERENASPRVRKLAEHLAELTEGFAVLVRRSGFSKHKASDLIAQALFNTELRLKVHRIAVDGGGADNDFEVRCSRRLIVSTLMNLIDNSIWWLDARWGEEPNKKRIYIAPSNDLSDGPAIVVADNGPGFQDPPEYLIEPFITRKPDGMGLGLHLADQVMRVNGGRLAFPQPGDVSLPPGLDGAVVALVFGKQKG
jgi:signal transduction histidine kinase